MNETIRLFHRVFRLEDITGVTEDGALEYGIIFAMISGIVWYIVTEARNPRTWIAQLLSAFCGMFFFFKTCSNIKYLFYRLFTCNSLAAGGVLIRYKKIVWVVVGCAIVWLHYST